MDCRRRDWTFPCRCGCEGGVEEEERKTDTHTHTHTERERERERRENMVRRQISGKQQESKKNFFFRRRTKVDIQSPPLSLKILLGTPGTDT